MRIQTKDLAGERTVKLWDAVPLDTPWTVYIDVTNLCNFACVYCPTGNPEMLHAAGRTQHNMPMPMYFKIVRDLGEFAQKVKIINLYKDGEPLVNPNFVEMVKILRDADVCERIYSKTNGGLIAHRPDLATAPLDMLGLSVPHVNDGMIFETVGRHVKYDQYRDAVKRLFEDSRRRFTINAKVGRYRMTDEQVEQFCRDFEPITDTVAVEGLHGWGANEIKDMFLEDHGPHDGSPVVWRLVCPLPFYMMSVSSNGITNVCCAEWGNFHNLGDVMQHSMNELWHNAARRAFQVMHLEGRRFENRACADCQYRDTLPDRIDDHAEEMLRRINGS